jgi:UV radiation resistance-associated gene protein
MHKGLQFQAQSQNHLLEARQTLAERKSIQTELSVSIAAQRRRICLDLQTIYPIESIDEEPLSFKIRGIRLPASGKFEGTPEEQVATALGWTAHLVYLLSGYLYVPLRYPVQPVGGRSLIRDPVSIMMGSRTYIAPTNDNLDFPCTQQEEINIVSNTQCSY